MVSSAKMFPRQFAIVLLSSLFAASQAEGAIVFSADFDSSSIPAAGVTGGLAGITTSESVQGYAGVGTGTNIFNGNFLRNKTGGSPDGTPGLKTTLTLANLPIHTSLDLHFLLAVIDSWDIASTGDTFTVLIDGNVLFSNNFTNNPDASLQGYIPPPGVLLTPRPFSQLGFNEGFEGRIGF